ncbi:hypothetical protein M438DRAFT_6888 [Aureobasidium pullulans EXF-150]|uniref:Uncharacterized protein n=1 Tax=Aureobasidium pullulans EXF-150 TaxID=1043002 RepID=A0A074Y0M7_AURPU|nr:uncharacterized protein M438DRAFT_6888 [Aureobasidium pullulans EXF-150]KEQ89464.1 hypothetical protein M438DRAFT_6888 [Aureobasidium pullulans EXF-150]
MAEIALLLIFTCALMAYPTSACVRVVVDITKRQQFIICLIRQSKLLSPSCCRKCELEKHECHDSELRSRLSKGAFELTTVCPSLPLYTHPTATSSSPSLYRQAVVAQWNGANSCLAPPGSNQRSLVRFTASTAYES